MVDVSNVTVVTMVSVAWRRESGQKKSGGGDDQEAEIDLSFSDSRSSTSYVNKGNSGGSDGDDENGWGGWREEKQKGRKEGEAVLPSGARVTRDARLLYSGFAPRVNKPITGTSNQ